MKRDPKRLKKAHAAYARERTALEESAAEANAITTAQLKLGAALQTLLTEAEQTTLYPATVEAKFRRGGLAAVAVELLRAHCARMAEAKALAGERRPQIVGEKFAGVLARMLFQQVRWANDNTTFEWASVFKSTLEVAYDAGTVEGRQLTLTDVHPGSKTGLVIADLRDRTAYADQTGAVSFESVLARVKGDPKPKAAK